MVRTGGHLLISVGNETAAFRNRPWLNGSSRSPSKADERADVVDARSLCGQYAPLTVSASAPPLKARNWEAPAGDVLVRHFGSAQALTASVRAASAGDAVGIDLDAPPLSNWKALPAVLQKLSGTAHGLARESTRKVIAR